MINNKYFINDKEHFRNQQKMFIQEKKISVANR